VPIRRESLAILKPSLSGGQANLDLRTLLGDRGKSPFRIQTIRTDKQESYQLLIYRDDFDLEKKLAEWRNFYTL